MISERYERYGKANEYIIELWNTGHFCLSRKIVRARKKSKWVERKKVVEAEYLKESDEEVQNSEPDVVYWNPKQHF